MTAAERQVKRRLKISEKRIEMRRNHPVPFELWKIGMKFWMSGKQYQVTDVGSRTIAAICIDCPERYRPASGTFIGAQLDASWFNGPPYAVVEHVMDENDLQVCYLERPNDEPE